MANHLHPWAAGLGLLLAATCGTGMAGPAPSISLVSVPDYGTDGNLTGRVSGVASASNAVAVHIFAGGWWTKPTFATPATTIGTDGVWSCDITTGGSDAYASQIAAYLIPATYSPPLASGWAQLPEALDAAALAQVRVTRPYSRRLAFSGYDWSVKDSRELTTGPGNNYFSDSASNAWVATDGRLHMKIARRAGRWYCAELVSLRSFGYGTYRITLDSPADALDARAVLGLFTWNDDGPYVHRELDVEVSRWTNAADTNNAQFVVQPYDTPGHLLRYRVPAAAATSTHSFAWASNRVDYASQTGTYGLPPATNAITAQWAFTTNGVPLAGGENFRINLWLADTNGPADAQDEEVIISRFVFVPQPVPPPAWVHLPASSPHGFVGIASNEPQLTYDVEVSTNLVQWQAWTSLTATNTALEVRDTNTPSQRYYRLSVPPQ